MVTTDEYADVPMPTGDDWARVSSAEGRFFGKECRTYPSVEEFNIKWDDKKPTAVWRGASTGCGVTIDTNARLKLAYLSKITPPDKDGPILDAGISKWQLRPRKLKNEKYLQTIDITEMNKLGIFHGNFLTPLQQSAYKYIVHVDGHVSAFRLSLELGMGCCILLADSRYRLWYRDMLEPMVHYVPVNADLSNLIEQIQWCRVNDKKCKKIAKNARKFYVQYLQKDGVLDYLQKLIIGLKNQGGIYLYNTETPLHRQIRLESNLESNYPVTTKTVSDINMIPQQARSFGVLKGLEWIINMINDKSVFSDVAKKGEIIFTNKNKSVKVQKYNLAGFAVVVKSTTDKTKEMENIHETYIGIKAINEVVKYIPNFAYVFGKFNDDTKSNVIMENISGVTFDSWLNSDKFNMRDYIFILIQIAMALEVAQKQIGFVHWDLKPWNIMIQSISAPVSFDYMIDEKTIYRVKTNIIPVIIDYGKSHVIYNQEHHGFVNMYKVSTIQDIISVILTSLDTIIKFSLTKNDTSNVVKLANFLSRTKYRNRPFVESGPKGVSDIDYFISRAKKYEELIYSDKYELEEKTPIDFVNYIKKNFTYEFPYEKIDTPLFRIDKGNPRQVYEYILSDTIDDKIQSFVNVFERVTKCDLSDTSNLLFVYYSAQTIEDNISSVYILMKRFLEKEGIDSSKYDLMYNHVIKKIKKTYENKIKNSDDEKVNYVIDDKLKSFVFSPYTENTFLRPDIVLNMLNNKINYPIDLFKYKNIIERILTNQGMFKLLENHKEYFMKNFQQLLELNSLIIQNNIANINTIYNTAKELYKTDNITLMSKLHEKKLIKMDLLIDEYMITYNKIDEL
jgi:hypothetical protein